MRAEGTQGRDRAGQRDARAFWALDLGQQGGERALEAQLQDLAIVDRGREQIAQRIGQRVDQIDLGSHRQRAQQHLDSLPLAFLARAGEQRGATQPRRADLGRRVLERDAFDRAHDLRVLLRALREPSHDHEGDAFRRHRFER